MADEIKPTPEEQLLRLIEGPDHSEVAASEVDGKSESKMSRFALGSRLRNAFSAIVYGGLNLKTLNHSLIVVTVGLVIYLTWEFAATQPVYDDIPLATRPAVEIKEIPIKHGWDYTDVVSARNPFKPVQEEKVDTPLVAQPPTDTSTQPIVEPPRVTKLDEIINALKLKGINWEPAPAIAIIQDDNINSTHVFTQDEVLKTKSTIGGRILEIQIKVKKISRDRVILSYEGEERELILTE